MGGTVQRRVRVRGIVQGVGFRPFCWRLARRHGLSGWVENDAAGVTIELRGDASAVAGFLTDLRDRPPPRACVESIDVADLPAGASPDLSASIDRGFVIHETPSPRSVPLAAGVPPDIATCDACLTEIRDPADRRHGYAFTTCADCGPRYTIATGMPYDRPRTTMRSFPMCTACSREYGDPADRRFHAQANACPACGPQVWFTTAGDPGGVAVERSTAPQRGLDAMAEARRRLRAGDMLAVKGIGGFHLVCDATNPASVERLRVRKHRESKPLAVMAADLEAAGDIAIAREQERRLLEGPERPIVLLHKRHGSPLAEAVTAASGMVGVMLPASPLHHLLCEGLPPLVMTSGNLSDEPIATDNRDAAARLGPLVDGFLMHDRDIHVPCDDSVVRCGGGVVLPIRRSRGYAPLPIPLVGSGPTVLAVGGDLKAAICLAEGPRAVMSQHIGDMGGLATLQAAERAAAHLTSLLAAEPRLIACDLHPGYQSRAWARRLAADRGIPVVAVQHHEAHVASLMAEHGLSREPLLGVCFDGTGYGHDGTIQGGEFFAVEHGRFRRAAHLETFPLPGGDACIRHPWRTALALLFAAGIDWEESLPPVRGIGPQERRVLHRQLATNLAVTATSSIGRLFDGVASIAGVRQSVSYEAEAAMELESLATRAAGDDGETYAMPIRDGDPLRIEWRPLVAGVVADVKRAVPREAIAGRFHRALATMIAEACLRLRDATGIRTVGLTGGVFQNALLVELAAERLRAAGFELLLHRRVPPNDGGLALGQAVLARSRGSPDPAGTTPLTASGSPRPLPRARPE